MHDLWLKYYKKLTLITHGFCKIIWIYSTHYLHWIIHLNFSFITLSNFYYNSLLQCRTAVFLYLSLFLSLDFTCVQVLLVSPPHLLDCRWLWVTRHKHQLCLHYCSGLQWLSNSFVIPLLLYIRYLFWNPIHHSPNLGTLASPDRKFFVSHSIDEYIGDIHLDEVHS